MKIKDFCQDEAEITVTGGDFSALLQSCEEQNIPLRQVHFRENALILTIPVEFLGQFRSLTAVCGCYGTVHRFRGGTRLLKQGYRHRVFFLAAAVAVILLAAVSASLWHCEIRTETGNPLPTAKERRVIAVIRETGLTFPTFKTTPDYDALAAEIAAECPEYAFVSVKSEGLTMKVTVVKKVAGKAPATGCKDIIAEKDGVIRSIFVLRGQQKAEVGATVSRGDLLISGTVAYEEEGKATVFRRTVAKGTVTASVWYEGMAFVSLREIYPRETGKTAGYIEYLDDKNRCLLWGRRRNSFGDSYTYKQNYTFRGKQIRIVTYRETVPTEKRYTEAEAFRKAKKEAVTKAKAAIPATAEIVDVKYTKLSAAAGAVGVRAVVETTEDIGMTQRNNPGDL